MIPYIYTPFGRIYTFSVMIAVAALFMFLSLHLVLRSAKNRDNEETYIFIKIIISGLFGFFISLITDAIFKIPENNGFVIKGMTFYGGLIGTVICMYFLLRLSKAQTQYSKIEWYNNLTIPLIIFHFFGRIGCFLPGVVTAKKPIVF